MREEKRSTKAEFMSAVEEMSAHVRVFSSTDARVKRRIEVAAVKLGYSWGFTKRLWFKELKRIDTEVSDHIRVKAAEHDRILRANMASAAEAMFRSDPDFYRPQIEAIGKLLIQNGNGNRQDGGQD